MTNTVTQIRELLIQVPVPPGYRLPPGATDAELAAFRAVSGLEIPNELEEWLRISNGPLVGAGGLYGVGEQGESRASTIAEILNLHPGWKDLGWIPVGGDGCGDYYVLSTKNPTTNGNAVLFIDCHEDELKPAYAVASNLWRFLRFHLRSELGHRYWPFDKVRVLEEDPELELVKGVVLPWQT